MDKVIIDGVDVSECDYCLNNKLKGKGHAPAKLMPYAKETSCIECKTNSTRYNFCKHNPNCYYKQLQRARAEIEELKQDIKTRTMCITCERELQNCNLKAENEKLKEENIKFTLDTKKLIEQYSERVDKYSQCLKDIKEIADEMLKGVSENCVKTTPYLDTYKQIQDKISKCIGVE